jgi:hypothetical protein
MSKKLLPLLMLCLTCLWRQDTYGQSCPEPPPQTSGTHSFRREFEIIDIPILVGDCQPIALELRWYNGRNNGSLFKVTFQDTGGQPIFVQHLSGFQTGHFEFPFSTFEPKPWLGTRSMLSVPSNVTIQVVPPFGLPANIEYTVTRAPGLSRRKQPELDSNVAMTLQIVAGKLLSKVQSSLQGSERQAELITYRLEEVQLSEPRSLQIQGKSESLEVAYRLMLTGGDYLAQVELIWIDDAPLPVFRRRHTQGGAQEIGAMIYDRSILRRDAEISISQNGSNRIYTLSEPLRLPTDFPASISPNAKEGQRTVEGNAVVRIHSATRTIGATRQPLVQMELNTNRPFPAKDSALQLQIGKQFFLNELSGDHSGRRLTLTLTPEMFAGLRQGAEVVAFFDKPDRSGFSDQNVWYFGRLNKEMLKE